MPSTSVPPPAIDALPRQAVRDPDYWLLAAAFLVLFVCGIQLLVFPFGRSQSAHALLGRAILTGSLPARDAWLAEAPGIGLLHAALQVTLGRSMMAFRAIETIALVGAVLGATRITKRWVGLERVGLLGGALFALTYVQLEIEQTGQPEFFAGVLLLLAVALCARDPSPRSSKPAAMLLGLLLGLTILLVPCLTPTVVPFFWLLMRHGKAQSERFNAPSVSFGCVAAGLLFPILSFSGWILAKGAGSVFVRDWLKPMAHLWFLPSAIEWASEGCNITYGAVLSQSALLTAGILATFTLGTIHEHERAGRRLLLSVIGFAIIGLAAQGQDNPGTLAAVLPLTSTLAGIGTYKAWRRLLTMGVAGTATFGVAAILLFQMCSPGDLSPGRFLQRSKVRLLYLAGQSPFRSRELLESELYSSKEYNLIASRRLATSLRERSLSNRDVWIMSDDPQVAWLLDALPMGRFLRPVPADVAHAAPSLKLRAEQEAAQLTPRIIVAADTTSDTENSNGLLLPARANYAQLESGDSWHVFQRVDSKVNHTDDSEFCDPNAN